MGEIIGLSREALERARRSRDARFDGKFFIAVLSTGIYCRPVCPARTHAAVRYYSSAAEAAEAGFRPCLRCRPEAAPGSPAWVGTSAVVRRTLRLIHQGALDSGSVAELAARIGVGVRHLNRLLVQQVGASPLAIAQTRRLHFAKRLLNDTNLPMTEIALAAGYQSLRRFNEAVKSTYKRPPSELRKHRARGTNDTSEITLKLSYRPPYDLSYMLTFFSRWAIEGIEQVDSSSYTRTVRTSVGHALIKISAYDDEHALRMQVSGAPSADLFELSSCARRVFDLAADPVEIANAFADDPQLGRLVVRRPGLRIPGIWDPYECAVRAIVERELSAEGARSVLNGLIARAGQLAAPATDGLTHLFPTAAIVATMDLTDLGLTTTQVDALRAVSSAVCNGALRFDDSVKDVTRGLARMPGVGRWVAQVVALCAFCEPDAFPTDDPLLRRETAAQGAPLTSRALETLAESWRPWRGYAASHLWAEGEAKWAKRAAAIAV